MGALECYGTWCGASAAPLVVEPENTHTIGVWVSQNCAITRKYKFCRTLYDYYFKNMVSKLQTVTLFRPIRSLQCSWLPIRYWSPTALKRPDRSKQCHYLQFAKYIAGLLHYYAYKNMVLWHYLSKLSNEYF